jgi:hypothetical protein
VSFPRLLPRQASPAMLGPGPRLIIRTSGLLNAIALILQDRALIRAASSLACSVVGDLSKSLEHCSDSGLRFAGSAGLWETS